MYPVLLYTIDFTTVLTLNIILYYVPGAWRRQIGNIKRQAMPLLSFTSKIEFQPKPL